MKQAGSKQRLHLHGKKIAIICARFYPELAEMLMRGVRDALSDCNVRDHHISSFDVPGCFELPLAALRVISSKRCDGVIALGAVVRGQTPHFEYVAGECSRGLMTVQLETGVPIGFGVLTTNTYDQAAERADPERGNKGYAAAIAVASLLKIPA